MLASADLLMSSIGVKLSSPLPLSDDGLDGEGLLGGDKQQESMSRRVAHRRVDVAFIHRITGVYRMYRSLGLSIEYIDCVAGVLTFSDRKLLNPKGAH